MKTKLFIGIFAVIITLTAPAAIGASDNSLREYFYQGNIYYNDENLKEAIDCYKKALSCGYESGPLYYNLGNAFFKSGELGKAIVYYMRAERLTPNDPDIKSNLSYAKSLIKGSVVNPAKALPVRLFFGLVNKFTLNRITALSVFIYILLCLFIILTVYLKPLKRPLTVLSVVTGILLVLSISVFSVKYNTQVIAKDAVVTARETGSRFEPLDNATVFFTLYEGELVRVTDSDKEWFKVRRPDGKQGWVKKTDIELI